MRQAGIRARGALIIGGASAWVIGSAALMTRDPSLGLMAGVSPLAAWAILTKSWARLIAVVGGGMLVLGSSSDLSSAKVTYAAVLIIAAAVSAYRLAINPVPFASQFRPLIWWGLAVIAYFFVSFLASPDGSDFGTFARQATFYLLLLVGPLIGIDAGRDLTPRTVHALIGVTGVIAAVGFALDWLDRRGVTSLPIGRIVLSSLALPSFAFALALVLAVHSSGALRRIVWMIPIVTIPVAMLVTGTRTNLITLAALAGVLGAKASFRIPPMQAISLTFFAAAIGLTAFPVVAGAVIAQEGFIESRIQAAILVLSGQGEADQSFSGRAQQFNVAMEMVASQPLLGYGLGYSIGFTLDTPLLTVVRLGWVGTLVVVGFVVALARAIWRTGREFGPSPAHTAWWGFLLVEIISLAFGTPFEDRGFGFTILLAAMAISATLTATNSFGVDKSLNRSLQGRADRHLSMRGRPGTSGRAGQTRQDQPGNMADRHFP